MANYLNIGDISGCLEVIGMFLESEDDLDLKETFQQWAEEEWNSYLYRSDSEIDFKKIYSLTENENKKFLSKAKMPKSFVGKYRKVGSCYKILYDNRFLWHKSMPNTRNALNEAYRMKKLYKVKCSMCGRIFYMDSISFWSVSWQSCIGEGCLAEAIEEVSVDYSNNLYDWNAKENTLQVVGEQLAQVDALINNVLTYYGDGKKDGLRIAYISDLHLHHHLRFYNKNEDRMIKDMVDKLYQSLESLNEGQFNQVFAIFLGGDISETPELTLKFLRTFRKNVDLPIFFVLGNHDFISFSDVPSCVNFYREKLQALRITLLYNEYVECRHAKEKFLIYGGTGFAKYDDAWNADNVVCCPGFTREDENRETAFFETAYQSALEAAKESKSCLLCLSHYPIRACLNNKYDKEVIYFTGHNHCNEYVRTEDKVLFADNQDGYDKIDIAFKEATTGLIINPYHALNDGLYQTTVKDYLKFYRYLGEYAGDGTLLYRRCKNADFYVVKRKGYYGFFMISTKKDSKGISIVNGGVTKKLTKSTEISWICENFDIVVSKYLQMLLPIRRVQEEISRELKELGLDGTIHGLIVDVDYYHHIGLNPIEGNANFYYASVFGYKMDLSSFDEMLTSLELRGLDQQKDYNLIRAKFEEKAMEKGYLLSTVSQNNLLEAESCEVEDTSQRVEQLVSRKEGMYGVSRKISPLQRLFTGRVLRDFDLRLTETAQQTAHRKKLYEGRVFKYEGVRYQITEDNGGDIVVAEELQKGSRSKGNGIRLSGNKRRFAIEELKAKIKKKDEWETYWIE